MKCIGFIGKSDKTELIGYISKIIAATGKKVIFLDATSSQKTRYTIPTIDGVDELAQYVTQHDGVDVAVGFSNMLELKKYLLTKGEDFNEYDYIMVDTDMDEMIEEYDLKSANVLFFVTSYDKMYIKKGIDLLKFISALKRRTDPDAVVTLYKLTFYSELLTTADRKFIEDCTDNLPLDWNQKTLDYPYDGGDLSVNIQNQYSKKFDIRMLSRAYKDALASTVEVITGDSIQTIKKVMKNAEKSARFFA